MTRLAKPIAAFGSAPADINVPHMPTGALVARNPLHSVAMPSIPPNTVARHERFWPLPQPALIIGFQPHMHFRGTRMRLEAIHPDGRREVLTDGTHDEQNRPITYTGKKRAARNGPTCPTPRRFPAGPILHTVSWRENPASNRHKPDPMAWVAWGSRTIHEMGRGWTDCAFLTGEQHKEGRAKRRALRTTTRSSQRN